MSLLKLCHGEKECHEMERFARTYCNLLSCKGGCKILYRLYLLFSFYSPKSSIFRMILFLCEKRRGLLRALPWNILLVLNSDFYFFYFPVLKIGPWANPINDRLMIRLTMINVKINHRFMFRFTMIHVLRNHRFKRWMSATRMS